MDRIEESIRRQMCPKKNREKEVRREGWRRSRSLHGVSWEISWEGMEGGSRDMLEGACPVREES